MNCSPGDVECIGVCLNRFNENIEVCPCQSKCPSGCPCAEYDCDSPRSEVLILSTRSPSNVPVMTNAAGDVDHDFYFTIDNDVDVYHSCSLTWQNEFYVYGGDITTTHVSKLNACRLERVGELAYNLNHVACASVSDERIYLCFDYDNINNSDTANKCRVGSSPVGQFNEVTPSRHYHRDTRIAANNGESIFY